MADRKQITPPEGYTLEQSSLPEGYTIEGEEQQSEPAPETMLHKAGRIGGDVLQGIGEGAFSTAANVGRITDPITKLFASPQAMERSNANIKAITTPQSTAQSVGKTGEQIGEFFTPTGVEGEAAKFAPKLLKPIARMGAAAIDTGLKNKAQGGEFTTGAAGGAGGELLGMGAQKIAPAVAETALGVTNRLRGRGRTIGKAILEETSGIHPETVAREAGSKIGALTNELESRTQAFSQPWSAASSTSPAVGIIDNAIAKATKQNAGPEIEQLQKLRSQLTKEYGTGKAIPAQLTPERILDMKRGVGKLVNSWAPQERRGIQPIIQQVYGSLDKELDTAVPGAKEINQRISSLIPARDRAKITENSAGVMQRMANRVARPTGALAGAGIGYYAHGIPGMVAGIAIPELVSSPEARMITARSLHSPFLPAAAKAIPLPLGRREPEAEEAKY